MELVPIYTVSVTPQETTPLTQPVVKPHGMWTCACLTLLFIVLIGCNASIFVGIVKWEPFFMLGGGIVALCSVAALHIAVRQGCFRE